MEEKQKNNTTLLLCIIIVLLLCIIAGLVYMNFNKDNKKDNVETKETTKEEKEEEKDYEVSDPKFPTIVEEAESLIPFGICNYPAFQFEKKNLTIDQLTDDTKIKMVMARYFSYNPEEKVIVNSRELTRYFEDLSFLDKLKSGKVASLDPMQIKYVGDNTVGDAQFEISSYPTGCEGAYEGEVFKVIDSSIKDDILTLTYADYWVTYDYEKDLYTFYSDDQKTVAYDNVVYDVDTEKYTVDGKDVDYTKFNKYILYFDVSNNKILFQKIVYEPVK